MPRFVVRPAPLIAACVAGAAAYLAIPAAPAQPAEQPRATLVVTARALDPARAVTPGDLETVDVAQLPPGAFDDATRLVGRRPLVAVPAGETLLGSHLAPAGAPADLWHRVPKGKRALAVRTDEVAGVAGFVRPGQHVDVIGVARDGERWHATTVAQDLQVLAVAQDDQDRGGVPPTPNALGGGGGQPRIATSTTLLASPIQAEAISLASERGALRLALRGPKDHAIRKVTPPPAPPAPPRQVAAPVPRAAAPAAPVAAPVQLAPTVRVAVPPAKPQHGGVEIIRGMPIPEGL